MKIYKIAQNKGDNIAESLYQKYLSDTTFFQIRQIVNECFKGLELLDFHIGPVVNDDSYDLKIQFIIPLPEGMANVFPESIKHFFKNKIEDIKIKVKNEIDSYPIVDTKWKELSGTRQVFPILDNEYNQFLTVYKASYNTKQMAEKYNIDVKKIYYILQKLGLDTKINGFPSKKWWRN